MSKSNLWRRRGFLFLFRWGRIWFYIWLSHQHCVECIANKGNECHRPDESQHRALPHHNDDKHNHPKIDPPTVEQNIFDSFHNFSDFSLYHTPFPQKVKGYFKLPIVRCQGIGVVGLRPSSVLTYSNSLH